MAEVRERGADDLAWCVDALHDTYLTAGYPVFWPDDPQALLSGANLGAWVAERDDKIVGHVLLQAEVPPPIVELTGVVPDRLAAIGRLYVASAGRRTGAAKALMAAAVDRARYLGRRPVLEVLTTATPAITLYEESGWTALGDGLADWLDLDGTRHAVRYYALRDGALPI